jgi:hypothetical protein
MLKKFIKNKLILKNVSKNRIVGKKVLLCYNLIPFIFNRKSHSNFAESKIIVNTFSKLGYQVDVVHFTSTRKVKYSNYDIIFGFGNIFENSFNEKNKKIIRIYYATGAHVHHQNMSELQRIIYFNERYSAKLGPQRIIPWCWSQSTTMSDFIILIGNNWTKSTYTKRSNVPVINLNATALTIQKLFIRNNIEQSKKSFVWFGSNGMVHKGLDLCLEYFKEDRSLTLHIFGHYEEEFYSVMRSYFELPNINYHGFVDVSSSKYEEVIKSSLFTILPSCSEGQATSILTNMAFGLIPVCTKFTGINVEELGFLINELNVKSVGKTITKIKSVDNIILTDMSSKCLNYISNNHSLESYSKNFYKILVNYIRN